MASVNAGFENLITRYFRRCGYLQEGGCKGVSFLRRRESMFDWAAELSKAMDPRVREDDIHSASRLCRVISKT